MQQLQLGIMQRLEEAETLAKRLAKTKSCKICGNCLIISS
jgi:hypothetical protein